MNCADAGRTANPDDLANQVASIRNAMDAATALPEGMYSAISGLLDQAAGISHPPAADGDGCCTRLDVRGIFASIELPDPEEQTDDRLYLRIDPFDVLLKRTDEGLVCDLFPAQGIESLASCYAFDSEAEVDKTG